MPESGCWIWTGAVNEKGYGYPGWSWFEKSAHRASWLLNYGPIPEGMYVCHKCDTPPCINPSHLFLGTHLENIADRVKKGRTIAPAGEHCKFARLKADQVRYIRSCSKSSHELADELGMAYCTITEIRRGETWRSLL